MSKTLPKLDLSEVGRTNLYHSDEERRLIDGAICRTNEALKRVREEKRAILLREEALKSELGRYLSARAPIKRLPDNVLCNMFEWHCQDASPVVVPFSRWFIPPQITISHVCSTWRQLMLDIPAFWCNIRLESDLAMKEADQADVAHAWLSRAKSLPCSVKIMFTNNSWLDPVCRQDWHTNIIKDLISSYKLKRLDLTFPDYHLRELLQLPDEKLCCIEDLCLRQVDLMGSATSETALPFELYKLSSLTSFSLSDHLLGIPRLVGIVYEDASRFTSIPWHQLRHINIHTTFPMLFCLRILELSSVVLETCSLDVYVDSSFMSSSPSSLKDPVHCSQLREFKVNIHSPSVTDSVPGIYNIIDPFLGSLRCPKLKSLTVGSNEQSNAGFILPRSINLQTFLRMQHVSEMHLEELAIYDTTSDLEVLPLLTGFPSLRRLVLPQTINLTEEVMDELGSGSIAPFLEDLTINKPMLVLEKLFQMIKTRSSVGKEDSTRKYKPTPFKSVILYCDDISSRKEYTDTVKEINKSGVNLNVSWGSYGSDDEFGTCSPLCGDIYPFEDYDEDRSDIYEW